MTHLAPTVSADAITKPALLLSPSAACAGPLLAAAAALGLEGELAVPGTGAVDMAGPRCVIAHPACEDWAISLAAALQCCPLLDVCALQRAGAHHLLASAAAPGGGLTTVCAALQPAVLVVQPGAWRTAAMEPVPRSLDLRGWRARCAVAVGRGVSAATLHSVHELCTELQAPLYATREAVWAGLAGDAQLLGLSGRSENFDMLWALGLSGAPQFLQGVPGQPYIAAINRDASAPIMQMAALAWVGDVDVCVPALVRALRVDKRC